MPEIEKYQNSKSVYECAKTLSRFGDFFPTDVIEGCTQTTVALTGKGFVFAIRRDNNQHKDTNSGLCSRRTLLQKQYLFRYNDAVWYMRSKLKGGCLGFGRKSRSD